MADKDPTFVDGFSALPDGMNSGVEPDLIPKTQTSISTNATHRLGYISNRPGFRKVTLDFQGDALAQQRFENSIWQGGVFFKSEYGAESMVVSIGGRLFEVAPNPDPSLNSAIVYERTISNGGVSDTNSSGLSIAWLWQAERWAIINDGESLPIFFDGAVSRRSLGESHGIGTTAADFTIPSVGSSVNVTLTSAYTGPVNHSVYIDGLLYQVNASASGYTAEITNLSESAGTTEAQDSQLIIPSNLLSQTTELQASGSSGGMIVLIVTLADVPSPALAVGEVITVRTSGINYVSAPITTIVNPQRVIIGPVPSGTILQTHSPVYRGYFSSSGIAGTLASAFNSPVVGGSSSVFLSSPYNGVLPQKVVINGGLFNITAVNNNPSLGTTVNVTNLNDTNSGTRGPTGSEGLGVFTTIPELPVGKMGAYGNGRNWMCLPDGRSYLASDIVGGSSGSPAVSSRDSVLNISENLLLAGGGNFAIPGNVGDITSMSFPTNLDESLGQGPLQIGTPGGFFSCQSPIDRTVWQDVTNPLLSTSLRGRGPLGQYGTIQVNSDTIFRALDGIGSFVLARREFTDSNTKGNTPISREMQRVIDEDNVQLLGNATSIQFDNRVLVGCLPVRGPLGVYHQGVIALNTDPVSNLRGKLPEIYDGLWTGLQVFQFISGKFSGDERAFAFCFETFTNKIVLMELSQSGEDEFDNSSNPITWSFETSRLFRNVKGKGEFDEIELMDGEIYLSHIQGVVHVQSWYRPDYLECWIPWHSFSICGTPNSPKQYRRRLGLGQPRPSDCDPTNNRPYRIGSTFQFRFQITGACKFRAGIFKASKSVDQYWSKVACSELCNFNPSAEDCEECTEQGPCTTFDLVFYSLNANKTYSNSPLVFQVECPNGTTQAVVVPANTINFTLPFPPGYDGDYPPLTLACSAGGTIVRSIPSGSSQEAIDSIVEGMIYECAQAIAEASADCSASPPSQFESEVVYFTGLQCPEGTPISYSGTLPTWITIDVDNSRLVGAAGTFFGSSQDAANQAAQFSINTFGNAAISSGDLVCGSPWTPADANPLHWYDANQIVGMTDGQVVDNWDDVGSGQNDLGGNADVTHPVYKTGILNGLPVVRWTLSPNNATKLSMQTVGATPGVNSPVQTAFNGLSQVHVFFVVMQRESSGLFLEAESNLIRLGTDGSGFYFVGLRRSASQSVTTLTSAQAKVTDQYDIVHLKVDYTNAQAWMDINGTTVINGSAFQDAGVSAQSAASFVPTNSAAASNMDSPEIVFDSNNLDQDTVDKYVGYLAHKYGLTGQLPIGHPYKNSPPIA